VPFPRGKVLGGSSAINGHLYVRGQALDFDQWAQMGNRGWGYEDVLPYFRRSEDRTGGGERFRGRGGPLHVSDVHERHPLCEAYMKGALAAGIPLNPDYNGACQEGVAYYQRTIRNGRRHSAAGAYLRPARGRPNLRILTHALATRLLLDGRRAVGVAYRRGGAIQEVRARREVILAGGAINSPQLLQISGIGPGPLLRELGVPVLHELPGVGESLRDHYQARVTFRVTRPITINERARGVRLLLEIARWLVWRGGMLAFSPAHVGAFLRTREELDQPDVQLTYAPASYQEGETGRLESLPGMTSGCWVMRPESRGRVRARSPDPADAPLIDPNYLADPYDQMTMVAGLKLTRRLLRSPELAPWRGEETMPGPAVEGDDEWLDFARRCGGTVFHAIGSCRMGSDPLAVVDDRLRVHGIARLRVVDASIMPAMPSANTNAATYMIAEKGADLIRADA
jgi:choline dehydrogenase